MVAPAGKVKTPERSLLLIVQPVRSTVCGVGLNSSTQPPGRSPSGFTSLIMIGGGETVSVFCAVRPATVAVISVLPPRRAEISPVVGSTAATTGKLELQVTGPPSICAPY